MFLIFHVFQQKGVSFRVSAVVPAAVAGAVDPRRAVQGVHHEAAVVGDGGEVACLHDGLCLDDGILLKGGAGLLRLHVHPGLRLGDNADAQLPQDIPHFNELGLVMAGQHEAFIPPASSALT